MQLQRRGPVGQEIPVIVDCATAYDLRPLTEDIDGEFLAGNGIATARTALASAALPVIDVTGMRIGAPVSRPAAVICIGQNYAAHAAETGDQPPEEPIIFLKHPNTVIGPDDDVRCPPSATALDWEVELAVVIGVLGRYLPDLRSALACIAGYTITNDVSERDYQWHRSGGQWSKGKCAETFNPLGPSLIPADEVADVQALGLRSFVNDERRQNSNTADMIFPVGELIRHLSQLLVLSPGDVINTGTPQGVAASASFPTCASGT
jgi:2,4-diketo-3-deoxy-L-fuconate hydrolase